MKLSKNNLASRSFGFGSFMPLLKDRYLLVGGT